MERIEYDRMAALEETLWWHRALHAGMIERLERAGISPGVRVLDAGCGTGGFLLRLRVARPDLAVEGLEFDTEAARIASGKTGVRITVGSVNAMPFSTGSFRVIVSSDVLCHAAVDEAAALSEFHRCLEPGGLLFLNLPAYPWLMSAHDAHVHNARRYSARSARELASAAGFARIHVGYWNTLLFPLMLLHRLLVGRNGTASDVRPFPAWQNRIFFSVTALERKLGFGKDGFRGPFGGSVWLRAEKS